MNAQMIQPRIVDIHEYYRIGGINPAKMKANFDIVGIRAAVGEDIDNLLEEHVDLCVDWAMPYFTYQVPVAWLDPEYQAEVYLSLYGVMDGPACQDVEISGGKIITAYQGQKHIEWIDKHHPCKCWYYSNNYYTKMFGNPRYIKERPVFWAEYPYRVYPFLYSDFDSFLAKYPWWVPRWAADLGITPIINQFTKKGDAQTFIANPKTDDPEHRDGIKSADFGVGLVSLADLLALWPTTPPQEPSDKEKLDKLWNAHPQLH